MIALSHEYVCRFNVAVNDPFGVSGVERVGNLDSKRQDQLHLQWAVRKMRCLSVTPSRNSMAIKDWVSCLPIS